jgi:hypothetical protein
MSSIHLLTDEPIAGPEQDSFGTHTRIAEALLEAIGSADVRDGAFSFGLYGGWGSGKTSVIEIVGKLIAKGKPNKEQPSPVLVRLDVWKYQGYPLNRAVLFELKRQLQRDSGLKEQFESYRYDKSTLEQTLNYECAFTEDVELTRAEVNDAWKLICRNWLAVLWVIGAALAVVAAVIPSVRGWTLPPWMKTVLSVVAAILGMIGVSSLFPKSVTGPLTDAITKLVFKKAVRDVRSKPAFSADQFESIFRDMAAKVKASRKLLVIVFDNIDRCEHRAAIEAVSAIRTFMDVPGCVYVVPCDDEALIRGFKQYDYRIDSAKRCL